MTLPLDTDIYRFAHDLLREHRDAAGLEAVRHAETMLGQGDMDGYTHWWRIAITAKHIQKIEQKADMAP